MFENAKNHETDFSGWRSTPQFMWPANGAQRAVEVRTAERDVAGPFEAGQRFMTCYSVRTDRGEYWAMTGTSGTWGRCDGHAF